MIDRYNIHCFLYDIFHIKTHHFKSKWLCKHNLHNFQLHSSIECMPEIEYEFDPTGTHIVSKIIKHNQTWTTYYKCYCCGKEVVVDVQDYKYR